MCDAEASVWTGVWTNAAVVYTEVPDGRILGPEREEK